MRTGCQRKVFSFISYCILFSITTRSLATKFARSPIIRSPIPCSPITCSATLTSQSLFPLITRSLIARLLPPTQYLVFCCPTCSLIAWSLFLWFSKNNPRKADDSNISGSHQKDASYDRGAGNCCGECSRKVSFLRLKATWWRRRSEEVDLWRKLFAHP